MNEMTRFSVSMPSALTSQIDAMVKEKKYPNRSQLLADLARDALVAHQAHRGAAEIAGTITLVFDHHKRNIQSCMTSVQHDYGSLIISVLHVHLDHDNCMEVLAVRGRARDVHALADRLLAIKGIKHGTFTVTTTGKEEK
jgi:CopG family transcriptional regulator, nickel-responsive regulator